jgi:tetratricopeptide (TPR) repeat protein
VLAFLLAVVEDAHGASCAVSDYAPAAADREAALLEGGSLSSSNRWADARAVYLWVLARHEDDPEALFGLARLDSWGGCYRLAEGEYLRILAVHPEDADVRAGYIDLLLWQGEIDAAARVLKRGLARDPTAAPLLQRAARLAYWSGDASAAVALGDAAELAAPDDGDVRAERDRLFLGEARLTGRIDHYPPGYQDLETYGVQVLQRLGRFDLYGGAEIVERSGVADVSNIVDAHYPIGLAYHPARGMTVGAEVEPGAPATAIADLALKVWVQAPVVHGVDAFWAYQLWHFSTGPEIVQILNPDIGIALPYELRLDVRGWISAATLAHNTRFVGAGGLQLGWQPTARLGVGVACTYGAELDQNPTLAQLLDYKAGVLSVYADRLISRHWGVRPTIGLDRRVAPDGTAIWIESGEVSAYARW